MVEESEEFRNSLKQGMEKDFSVCAEKMKQDVLFSRVTS